MPETPGIRVEARFGVSMFVLASMLVWFGGVGYVALGGFLVALDRGVAPGEVSALLAPVGMLVFCAALCAFGRWLARDEEASLLRETLQAEESKGVSFSGVLRKGCASSQKP